MKTWTILGIFLVVVGFSQGTAFALTPQQQQVDHELELMAKDIAELCAQPGFRGFLRSEIAKSKNRENIIELTPFLERAAKQKGMPKNVGNVSKKVKDARMRHKEMELTGLEGFDLYIPVDAHKAKWKGGEDFFVAFSPVEDEGEVKQIVAFSVRDGKRVTLDPAKAPEAVVLVLAPCEHETHAVTPMPQPDKKEPLPAPVSREEAERQMKKPTGKESMHPEGNSALQLRYTMIYSDKEPWYKGDPEIYVIYAQGRYGQPLVEKRNLTGVNQEDRFYWTGSTDQLYFIFDSTHTNQSYVAVWESDGSGAWIFGPEASTLDLISFLTSYIKRSCSVDGTPCEYRVYGGDDYVGGARFYKDWYPWGYSGIGLYCPNDAYFKVGKWH